MGTAQRSQGCQGSGGMELRDGRSAAQLAPPKKPRTSGSGTGARKVKKPKGRGQSKLKGGNDWAPSHSVARGRAKAGKRMQGSAPEQPEPKRRRTSAFADEAISAQAARELSGDSLLEETAAKETYKKPNPVISLEARRFAVSFSFFDLFGAPLECEWNSRRD